MNQDKPIDFASDTFNELTEDMSDSLNTLLNNLLASGANKASMTVKLAIYMSQKQLEQETVIIPRFRYHITSSVDIKSAVDGDIVCNYMLGKNVDGDFVLRSLPIS